MPALRSTIHSKLKRFSADQGLNLSDVEEFVAVSRPLSVGALLQRVEQLPDSITLSRPIVTDEELEGSVTFTLTSDGVYKFSGFMRATGTPSFKFRITAVIRAGTGTAALAAQRSGEVFGADSTGPRLQQWSEVGHDIHQMKVIRNMWPDISSGVMHVNHSQEQTGTLVFLRDLAIDVAVFAGAVVSGAGVGVAVVLVVGLELDRVGVHLPGAGGIIGVAIVAGTVLIFGPAAIIPAIVAGVGIGLVVDTMLNIRSLLVDEIAFARQVFGDTLNYDKIRLTNLLGAGNRPFTTPTLDGTILLNMGNASNDPTQFPLNSGFHYEPYPAPGQLFIHELTHAWQFQHASLKDGCVPGMLCKGIMTQISEGDDAYRYGRAGLAWSSYGMEAQAAIVDQWFGGNHAQSTTPSGEPATPMDPASAYFDYIASNIRTGVP